MIFSSAKISMSTDNIEFVNAKLNFFQPVIQKLLKKGIDSSFIFKIIEDERSQFDEKFVKINVTGYLKKADYSHNYNSNSISKSKQFIENNLELLNRAEAKYGVPKEVISSILWVETKHGSYLGNNQIISVYLSTAMCDHPEYVLINKTELRNNFKGSQEELQSLEKKIDERSAKKANWAIEQIIALNKMDKFQYINILEIKGSWAGAFGLSQFLPSSYVSWAVDGNDDGKIDLFNLEDAVFSVANYLKTNGWGNTKETERKAVFHYNNSNAYVDAVLKLAQKSKSIDAVDSISTESIPTLNQQMR